ncbi:MAG: ribonuclease III [Clostridiales bacterium]|nr:ribonuclease III [Candidatus Coliplasma equi]
MEKSIEFIKRNYSPLVLAYMGDAYYETLAREYIISDGDCKVSNLNETIKKIITAESQSRIIGVMLPLLDENETSFYKLGRNARNTHHSHSAAAVAYRRATGLECLFGYLYLSESFERASQLFKDAVRDTFEKENNND